MRKELILMRHGKSDWAKALPDYQRPIKKRGFEESARVGLWLREQGLVPELLMSSPARRARDTAETVASNMDYSEENIFWNESVYMADVSE
ncbi:MAG: histidine phosphatase family protein, partial [Gammaproteobacteria bacterium]|nr:histidine phosphatase family protein [Gammaproteobacteria bacterium]